MSANTSFRDGSISEMVLEPATVIGLEFDEATIDAICIIFFSAHTLHEVFLRAYNQDPSDNDTYADPAPSLSEYCQSGRRDVAGIILHEKAAAFEELVTKLQYQATSIYTAKCRFRSKYKWMARCSSRRIRSLQQDKDLLRSQITAGLTDEQKKEIAPLKRIPLLEVADGRVRALERHIRNMREDFMVLSCAAQSLNPVPEGEWLQSMRWAVEKLKVASIGECFKIASSRVQKHNADLFRARKSTS